VFIARHGRQDLFKLRGIDRPLSQLEKYIVAELLVKMLRDEVTPLTPAGS
jgi:hypothetical protein